MKRIAILGSTGSIGTQALEVVRKHTNEFSAEVLTSFNNYELLIKQAIEFKPNAVVIVNEDYYHVVCDALHKFDIKVFSGMDALEQIVEFDTIDVVLTAVVGFAGLRPTINALMHNKVIALANKETLVVAGELITKLAAQRRCPVLPVDSEHSAIFQSIVGEQFNLIEKIFLTGSGGPFRRYSSEDLKKVTIEQALNHPVWSMGRKVTIDSSTLMNKGLEMIEAKWLFNVSADQIEVVIHPQSIIHSLVQFQDSSIKAQLGLPDMKLPIQYAFSFPFRFKNDFKRFDFSDYSALTFEKPDRNVFGCLDLAYHAINRGGNLPCVLNAANEIAVESFLSGKIGFTDIALLIEKCMGKVSFIEAPSYDDLVLTDLESRKLALDLI